MKKVMQFFIRCYQLMLSTVMPGCCRFYPSCSCYAIEALEKHGVFLGSCMTIRRISHCHPFNAGGYDPVPEKESS